MSTDLHIDYSFSLEKNPFERLAKHKFNNALLNVLRDTHGFVLQSQFGEYLKSQGFSESVRTVNNEEIYTYSADKNAPSSIGDAVITYRSSDDSIWVNQIIKDGTCEELSGSDLLALRKFKPALVSIYQTDDKECRIVFTNSSFNSPEKTCFSIPSKIDFLPVTHVAFIQTTSDLVLLPAKTIGNSLFNSIDCPNFKAVLPANLDVGSSVVRDAICHMPKDSIIICEPESTVRKALSEFEHNCRTMSIAEYMDAFLDQSREENTTGTEKGTDNLREQEELEL